MTINCSAMKFWWNRWEILKHSLKDAASQSLIRMIARTRHCAMGVWAMFLASSMPTGTRTRQTGAATMPKQISKTTPRSKPQRKWFLGGANVAQKA